MPSEFVNEDFLAEAHGFAVLNAQHLLTGLCEKIDDADDRQAKELAIHIMHETCWLMLSKLYSNFIDNPLDVFLEMSDKMKSKLNEIKEEDL
jgi:hypothetical protein